MEPPALRRDASSYESLDKRYLWHPFTQHQFWNQCSPLIVDAAEGFELIDVDGSRYLDGVSSLWCNVHGHGHPALLEALRKQSEKLCHSTLLGLSHTAVLDLAEELTSVIPANLTRLFFSDSGTSAVEAALRIALEWWQKQPDAASHKRKKLLSLDGAYHGDTIGAVGVGFLPAFHRNVSPVLVPALRTPPPHLFRFSDGLPEEAAVQASLDSLRALLQREGDAIAAFFVEPLVQGAAGIWTHPESFLREAISLCRKHGVLVIADEVATGFGKTGDLFAVQKAGIQPDILVMGKGLSGGYLPISAACTTEALFNGFLGELSEGKTFYYGQTFAGNPLAAAVSAENLRLLRNDQTLQKLNERLPAFHRAIDEKIAPLPQVDEVRRNGVMVGIELTQTPGEHDPFPADSRTSWKIVDAARRRGVVIRPLGNVIILMPAVAMPEADLLRLVDVTAEALIEGVS
ncbi:MAG: adenosylmethionine--8-amino-7-oxononanoate transaminase [Bdellovibrionales bacterium]|nr:adenosylmethionine--8-amino-7-oxononanoate transaminase [Bdellovibrionales bacterium]